MCPVEDLESEFPILSEHLDYTCCETKLISLKKFDDTLIKLNEFKLFYSVVTYFSNQNLNSTDFTNKNLILNYHSPPLNTPLFIKNSSLLI